jgi:hypothetical protein
VGVSQGVKAQGMNREALVSDIARAIATMEGYYVTGSIAARNYNPGNLRSWGSLPIVQGFAQFPSESEGFRALHRQINLLIDRQLNLYEFFCGKAGIYPGYAPDADGNHCRAYAEFVAGKVGIAADMPLDRVIATAAAEWPYVSGLFMTLIVIGAVAVWFAWKGKLL